MRPDTQYARRRAQGRCGRCGRANSPAFCSVCRRQCGERGWGPPPATLGQIAEVLGCSREYVRLVQEAALVKMMKRSGLSRDDLLLGLAILGCEGDESVPSPGVH